jgi:hypothetical protein
MSSAKRSFPKLDDWFEKEKTAYGPNTNYYFKGSHFWSKLRGFYARVFNPTYINGFSTTLFPNTFFAESLRYREDDALEVEFHENVHKWDRASDGIIFNLKYLFPHWLALPFMLLAVIFGGWQTWIAFGGYCGGPPRWAKLAGPFYRPENV